MKVLLKSAFGIVLGLAAAAGAAPSPSLESDLIFNSSVPLNVSLPFNVTLPPNITDDTVSTLGFDPSYHYQGWATIEVWTGGDGCQPVNVGNVIGHDLHQLITRQLDRLCPYQTIQHGGYCDNWSWQTFGTKYLKTPPAGVDWTGVWYRVNGGQFSTEGIRVTLMNIVGRVLYAYTTQPLGTNCYEIPGQGKYCNIPRFVRVNLPQGSPAFPDWQNYLHVEFYGSPTKLSQHGNLKPCGTRAAVDVELDNYMSLEGEFPAWKGHFKRETRVIIDGYKVCSDES